MFNGGDSGGLEELISRSIQTNKDIIIDHVNHSHDDDDDQNSFNVNDDIAINDIVTTPFNINPNIDLLSPDNNVVFLDANKCIYTTPLETTTDQPGGGFVLMPKLEHINNYYGCNSNIDFINHMNLIGLNLLGHHDHDHMCFSILGDEENINVVNDHMFGGGWSKMEAGVMNVPPTCQIEGCNADLTLAKHYHRRHKVCEFHSKASIVLAAGVTQRYCQQCSRFHILSEFDEGKRSCRKRLADHNRRRRKLSHNESTNLINDQP